MVIDGQRSLIAGSSGSGKSYFAENTVLKTVLKNNKGARVVVFDPECSWDYSGFLIVNTLTELVDVLSDCWDGYFKVIYQPNRHGDMVQECHNVAVLIDKLQEPYLSSGGTVGNPVHLFIDESHFVLSNSREYSGVQMLVRTGRKRGINIYFITQGLKDLPTWCRNNIEKFVCFKLAPNADRDIETLRSMVGKTKVDELQKASQYSYLRMSLDKIELVKSK